MQNCKAWEEFHQPLSPRARGAKARGVPGVRTTAADAAAPPANDPAPDTAPRRDADYRQSVDPAATLYPLTPQTRGSPAARVKQTGFPRGAH